MLRQKYTITHTDTFMVCFLRAVYQAKDNFLNVKVDTVHVLDFAHDTYSSRAFEGGGVVI